MCNTNPKLRTPSPTRLRFDRRSITKPRHRHGGRGGRAAPPPGPAPGRFERGAVTGQDETVTVRVRAESRERVTNNIPVMLSNATATIQPIRRATYPRSASERRTPAPPPRAPARPGAPACGGRRPGGPGEIREGATRYARAREQISLDLACRLGAARRAVGTLIKQRT